MLFEVILYFYYLYVLYVCIICMYYLYVLSVPTTKLVIYAQSEF